MSKIKARCNTVHRQVSGRVNHAKSWNIPCFTVMLAANNDLSFRKVVVYFEQISIPKKVLPNAELKK